ncbi:DUF3883 domain-containing protein [Rhodanobacter soli]|mgnify:FL=1|jgi:hypothetical protein|uniref:Protein NO VEIN C-terminal domain-containing protein n=1 Tax=Rhodanobacter soli TaxID=590609 RepID=A0ABV2PTQ3_9GAMM
MARGDDWSRVEVEACVASYLMMLALELNGQRYNKTEHAEALMRKLDGRNRGSVEFKHCNISAVLLALGYPSINGYKPRSNYQSELLDVVESQLEGNTVIDTAAQAAVERPAIEIAVNESMSVWVPAPKPAKVRETASEYAPRFSPVRRDYLAREARNRSLGRAGELFVLELESRRLHGEGKKALSERVEHVAASQGDGLGYDILSFESNGRERLIEVKTTAFGELTPFYVSRNEIARSNADADKYRLYRIFDFRDKPRVFQLPGSIDGHCTLDPVTYLARFTA